MTKRISTLTVLVSCTALLALFQAAAAKADFSDWLRSISKSVGNKPAAKEPPKPDDGSLAGTIGIRGIDEVSGAAQAGARGDVKQLDAWAVGRAEAEQSAHKKGLQAVNAKLSAATKL